MINENELPLPDYVSLSIKRHFIILVWYASSKCVERPSNCGNPRGNLAGAIWQTQVSDSKREGTKLLIWSLAGMLEFVELRACTWAFGFLARVDVHTRGTHPAPTLRRHHVGGAWAPCVPTPHQTHVSGRQGYGSCHGCTTVTYCAECQLQNHVGCRPTECQLVAGPLNASC